MRKETLQILEIAFGINEINQLKEFAQIIDNFPRNEEKHYAIWTYDQALGGFGGHACPLNPVDNPFNTLGRFRNVFRSLQYSRSDMFLRFRPRHIIEDAGLHVEALVKILVEKTSKLSAILNRKQLGGNLETLKKHRVISEAEVNLIKIYKDVLNLAKHDTDDEEIFTFDTMDSVVFYFTTRKIGNVLLMKLNHETCGKYYEIRI